MLVNCDNCKQPFKRKPSTIKKLNFCSSNCRTDFAYITKECSNCGNTITKLKSSTKNARDIFCNRVCFHTWNSKRFTKMNVALNPTRMTMVVRNKLRQVHLGSGKGVSYEKTFGVHTHRVVAEKKLGRPLRKGEVVHHHDEQIRNNHPDNIIVFPSQAEHARWHKIKPQIERAFKDITDGL